MVFLGRLGFLKRRDRSADTDGREDYDEYVMIGGISSFWGHVGIYAYRADAMLSGDD
jgi:hypothetical protein